MGWVGLLHPASYPGQTQLQRRAPLDTAGGRAVSTKPMLVRPRYGYRKVEFKYMDKLCDEMWIEYRPKLNKWDVQRLDPNGYAIAQRVMRGTKARFHTLLDAAAFIIGNGKTIHKNFKHDTTVEPVFDAGHLEELIYLMRDMV